MKKLLLLISCSICFVAGFAQLKAITENGDEVFLYDDGSWTLVGDPAPYEFETLELNPKAFEKDSKSSFLLKSNRTNMGIWLDPKKWTFKKAEVNSEAEYEFQLKDGDLYGMLISERVAIPLETLRGIALENGRSVAPDLHIDKEEYRTVNGLKMLFLQMSGTMQGIKFSYYGYYYTNDNGTVQFVTYTAQNLLEEYIPECELLLGGLVENI